MQLREQLNAAASFVSGWHRALPTTRPCLRLQAISDWRAKLSERWNPTDALANDDQNIIQSNGVSPTLVPSNGYTFDRIPSQVRRSLSTRLSRDCPGVQ